MNQLKYGKYSKLLAFFLFFPPQSMTKDGILYMVTRKKILLVSTRNLLLFLAA